MEQMNITSAQYVNDPLDNVVCGVRATIDGRSMFVPMNSANRHYAEIMRQVEAGELTIQDADD